MPSVDTKKNKTVYDVLAAWTRITGLLPDRILLGDIVHAREFDIDILPFDRTLVVAAQASCVVSVQPSEICKPLALHVIAEAPASLLVSQFRIGHIDQLWSEENEGPWTAEIVHRKPPGLSVSDGKSFDTLQPSLRAQLTVKNRLNVPQVFFAYLEVMRAK